MIQSGDRVRRRNNVRPEHFNYGVARSRPVDGIIEVQVGQRAFTVWTVSGTELVPEDDADFFLQDNDTEAEVVALD